MSFQIKYVYSLIDNISPKLNKIRGSLRRTERQAIKTANKANVSFRKFTNRLNSVKRAAGKLANKLERVGKSAINLGKSLFLKTTLPIALLGASFIKAASDAEETASKFSVVFQDVSKESEQTARNLAKDFGLSTSKAKELLGDTGDLLTGFGFTGKSALDLSKKVNQLAVDLASFTNFSGGAEGASKALTKALLGERESVKSLGISILEEDVKKKVATLVAKGFTFQTERQAKAVATLQIAIEQSKNAVGDYARTSTAFANRIRVLSQRFLDFKIILGKIILPLALKLVNTTIKLINKFNKLSPTVKKIILIIAGLTAVIAPLLIGLGLMIISLKVLTAVFLLNPFGLIFLAIVALGIVMFIFREKIKNLIAMLIKFAVAIGTFFKNIFSKVSGFFDSLIEKIGIVLSAIRTLIDPLLQLNSLVAKGLGKAFNFGRSLFGDVNADQELINKPNQNINTNNLINEARAVQQEPNKFNVNGQLGININGLPKGSSANLATGFDNDLPIGLNSVFSGT